MSLTFTCLNIKVDNKQHITYNDKLFAFRKSQLTIAKKTKSLETFISTKLLFKIDEIHNYPCLIKFNSEHLYIYCNQDFKIKEIHNIIDFINIIFFQHSQHNHIKNFKNSPKVQCLSVFEALVLTCVMRTIKPDSRLRHKVTPLKKQLSIETPA